MESKRVRKRFLPAIFSAVLLGCTMFGTGGALASPTLFDYQVDVDGATIGSWFDDTDFDGFDETTGLGTVTVTVTDSGSHSVIGFFDHEFRGEVIDVDFFGDEVFESVYFDESAASTGALAAGQSWEVDEPTDIYLDDGYGYSDILDNVAAEDLDNSLGALDPLYSKTLGVDDVSMAIGWQFTLAAGEQATVAFILSTVAPTSGFYLTHSDEYLDEAVYFSSTLDKPTNPNPSPVPLPAAGWLMLSAIVGLGFTRRKAKA